MTRLADLLQQGVIMKQKFQPYEAHLGYLLQFMVDFNLYGCDYLDSSAVRFRAPVPERGPGSSASHLWHSHSITEEYITDDASLPRVSHCSIEVDICVQDISNRKRIKERPLHHDFSARTNPLPGDVKLVDSMVGLWKDETKRRKRKMQDPHSGSSPFPPEALVSMSADPRHSQPQGWIHEEEYRNQIRHLISAEKQVAGIDEITFESFATSLPFEDQVRTALQSVEDLFPSNLAPVLGLPSGAAQAKQNVTSSIEVDEREVLQIGQAHDDLFPNDSDEEVITKFVKMEKNTTNRSRASVGLFSEGISALDALDDFDEPPPWNSIVGVCQSGLSSGTLPEIPICKELLDAAENEGLIGRKPKARPPSHSDHTATKRPLSEEPGRRDGSGSPTRNIVGFAFCICAQECIRAGKASKSEGGLYGRAERSCCF